MRYRLYAYNAFRFQFLFYFILSSLFVPLMAAAETRDTEVDDDGKVSADYLTNNWHLELQEPDAAALQIRHISDNLRVLTDLVITEVVNAVDQHEAVNAIDQHEALYAVVQAYVPRIDNELDALLMIGNQINSQKALSRVIHYAMKLHRPGYAIEAAMYLIDRFNNKAVQANIAKISQRYPEMTILSKYLTIDDEYPDIDTIGKDIFIKDMSFSWTVTKDTQDQETEALAALRRYLLSYQLPDNIEFKLPLNIPRPEVYTIKEEYIRYSVIPALNNLFLPSSEIDPDYLIENLYDIAEAQLARAVGIDKLLLLRLRLDTKMLCDNVYRNCLLEDTDFIKSLKQRLSYALEILSSKPSQAQIIKTSNMLANLYFTLGDLAMSRRWFAEAAIQGDSYAFMRWFIAYVQCQLKTNPSISVSGIETQAQQLVDSLGTEKAFNYKHQLINYLISYVISLKDHELATILYQAIAADIEQEFNLLSTALIEHKDFKLFTEVHFELAKLYASPDNPSHNLESAKQHGELAIKTNHPQAYELFKIIPELVEKHIHLNSNPSVLAWLSSMAKNDALNNLLDQLAILYSFDQQKTLLRDYFGLYKGVTVHLALLACIVNLIRLTTLKLIKKYFQTNQAATNLNPAPQTQGEQALERQAEEKTELERTQIKSLKQLAKFDDKLKTLFVSTKLNFISFYSGGSNPSGISKFISIVEPEAKINLKYRDASFEVNLHSYIFQLLTELNEKNPRVNFKFEKSEDNYIYLTIEIKNNLQKLDIKDIALNTSQHFYMQSDAYQAELTRQAEEEKARKEKAIEQEKELKLQREKAKEQQRLKDDELKRQQKELEERKRQEAEARRREREAKKKQQLKEFRRKLGGKKDKKNKSTADSNTNTGAVALDTDKTNALADDQAKMSTQEEVPHKEDRAVAHETVADEVDITPPEPSSSSSSTSDREHEGDYELEAEPAPIDKPTTTYTVLPAISKRGQTSIDNTPKRRKSSKGKRPAKHEQVIITDTWATLNNDELQRLIGFIPHIIETYTMVFQQSMQNETININSPAASIRALFALLGRSFETMASVHRSSMANDIRNALMHSDIEGNIQNFAAIADLITQASNKNNDLNLTTVLQKTQELKKIDVADKQVLVDSIKAEIKQLTALFNLLSHKANNRNSLREILQNKIAGESLLVDDVTAWGIIGCILLLRERITNLLRDELPAGMKFNKEFNDWFAQCKNLRNHFAHNRISMPNYYDLIQFAFNTYKYANEVERNINRIHAQISPRKNSSYRAKVEKKEKQPPKVAKPVSHELNKPTAKKTTAFNKK